jgi:hypothetical protein
MCHDLHQSQEQRKVTDWIIAVCPLDSNAVHAKQRTGSFFFNAALCPQFSMISMKTMSRPWHKPISIWATIAVRIRALREDGTVHWSRIYCKRYIIAAGDCES